MSKQTVATAKLDKHFFDFKIFLPKGHNESSQPLGKNWFVWCDGTATQCVRDDNLVGKPLDFEDLYHN